MRNFVNKYLILIVVFYVFWLVWLPLTFNKVVSTICANLSKNTNYIITIENPQLKLNIIPTATLHADILTIEQKNLENKIYINYPTINFRLLPLLSGKIHINSVSIHDFVLQSSIEKNLVFEKNLIAKLKKSKIKVDKFQINESKVLIKSLNNQAPVTILLKNFYLCSTNNKFCLKFQNSLNINNIKSTLNVDIFLNKNGQKNNNLVDIEASNIDLSILQDCFSSYLPNCITQATGVIYLKIKNNSFHAILHNCKILMQNKFDTILLPEKVEISSNFDLTSKKITFDFVEISAQNIKAKIAGYITHYMDSVLSQVDLNIMILESNVEDIIAMLPSIKIEEIDFGKLKEHQFKGNIIGNFNLSGKLNQPNVLGDILIKNVSLNSFKPRMKGATIKLDFLGKTLNYDVIIPIGSYEKVWVKGDVELYNVKYADLHVWSTPKVDLNMAKKIIEPLHEILNFDIGPLPILSLNGYGNADLIIKGNRKNSHIWGKINLNSLSVALLL